MEIFNIHHGEERYDSIDWWVATGANTNYCDGGDGRMFSGWRKSAIKHLGSMQDVVTMPERRQRYFNFI